MDKATPSPHFCEAAPIYTKVVKMDPKGSKLRVAAYAAVVSWKNCLDVADDGQEAAAAMQVEIQKKHVKRGDLELLAEKTIPDKQQKMLEAFDTYIKYVPDAPELVTIKYRRAFVDYMYNRFDAAIPLLSFMSADRIWPLTLGAS